MTHLFNELQTFEAIKKGRSKEDEANVAEQKSSSYNSKTMQPADTNVGKESPTHGGQVLHFFLLFPLQKWLIHDHL